MTLDVEDGSGRRKRGRPKIKIMDAVKVDMMIGVTEGRARVKV